MDPLPLRSIPWGTWWGKSWFAIFTDFCGWFQNISMTFLSLELGMTISYTEVTSPLIVILPLKALLWLSLTWYLAWSRHSTITRRIRGETLLRLSIAFKLKSEVFATQAPARSGPWPPSQLPLGPSPRSLTAFSHTNLPSLLPMIRVLPTSGTSHRLFPLHRTLLPLT